MDLADLINLIIAKFGGNRIEFLHVEWDQHTDDNRVEFVHGGNCYSALQHCSNDRVDVWQTLKDQGPLTATIGSRWIEGVLNGKVRNEAGELVDLQTGSN